jgi:hypothetical protein
MNATTVTVTTICCCVIQVMLRRTLVKLRDVRLSTLVGDGSDGIAYVQLAGFSQGAGTELASTYYNCF